MVLVDTSAWIEFLRDTGSATCSRVDELLAGDMATCHPIRMEVLAGARDENHLHDLRRLLARATLLPTGAMDYEDGAALYRACRRPQRLSEVGVTAADLDLLASEAMKQERLLVNNPCPITEADARRLYEAAL